ncbi:MAG: isochorismatase family protein [Roseiflexaceae bacterium]|nr:isochorismatase family protein [Roseiflexaceae bacterium]
MSINLTTNAQPFLAYLEEWYGQLTEQSLAEIIGSQPQRVAVISIDVINGFCVSGPLASARVGRIAKPVADLFRRAHILGIRNLVLTQDTHDPSAPEFSVYPPHCLKGTAESEAVDELKELPFYDSIKIVEKNSINSTIGTDFGAWIAAHPQIDTFIVVGDCTDLCTYQAAMSLRLEANAGNFTRRVIVSADEVDTFDTPVAVARELGIRAHDADLHHVLFLHHMAINGIEVVAKLV